MGPEGTSRKKSVKIFLLGAKSPSHSGGFFLLRGLTSPAAKALASAAFGGEQAARIRWKGDERRSQFLHNSVRFLLENARICTERGEGYGRAG
ncbi:unnamed protein product [Bursaphelenchus xylophilus]|uniref:(pine wood nematode) hypothetical protein n=1 Tax=Bursaphelenchus xylophilus TaxID=6326 RepID=A0A1I7SBM0_BURXY|nr:unnamed protein product [Bursaphelenchus xylophilus]CAG9114467.1 unnamed protein product [Bursaphelenchus xylophilus]